LVREQERDTVLLEVLERRHDRWGALRDDDREHLVLLDELACVCHRVLRLVTVVVPDRPHLPAVDAHAVVDGLEAEIHPELRDLLAREGQRARERVRAAEQDLGVGDALLGARRRRDHHDEGEQRKEPSGSHGRSPCSGVREPGAIGGWPETRRAPAPVPLPPLIPVHAASPAHIGGWPETRRAPAPVPLPPLIPVHAASPAHIGGRPETWRAATPDRLPPPTPRHAPRPAPPVPCPAPRG